MNTDFNPNTPHSPKSEDISFSTRDSESDLTRIAPRMKHRLTKAILYRLPKGAYLVSDIEIPNVRTPSGEGVRYVFHKPSQNLDADWQEHLPPHAMGCICTIYESLESVPEATRPFIEPDAAATVFVMKCIRAYKSGAWCEIGNRPPSLATKGKRKQTQDGASKQSAP
jgi:hypothetical protein